MARMKFEVGRITNLGANKSEENKKETEQKEKRPIGFMSPESKSETVHKLNKIGFASPSSEQEFEEEKSKE